MAEFGRGADTWWEDDEAWETVEEIDPVSWGELNEDDPQWPVAVLIEDCQDWEEGGDVPLPSRLAARYPRNALTASAR
ncbi:hypothetical protein ACTMTJ_41885 [Phytohabitans sp. LJ34]|uniref:hypothetical protein n=1 Tax=Phytohabitans sp. LJ34 TaxID=3452217 RepID=UPI003F8B56BD